MNRQITRFYQPLGGYIKDKEFIKKRGLDEQCEKKYKHQWLLFPKHRGQKQYLICLYCMETSHL